MLVLDYFYAIHYLHEAGLQGFCLFYQGLVSILAHLLNLFAAPARAHGSRIAVVVFLLFQLDIGAVTGNNDGTAGLATAQTWSWLEHGVFWLLLVAHRRATRRGGHVVWVRRPAVWVLVGGGRIRRDGDLWMLGRR